MIETNLSYEDKILNALRITDALDEMETEEARHVFDDLRARGSLGELAICLLKAQKASDQADEAEDGQLRDRFHEDEMDAVDEIIEILLDGPVDIRWGLGIDFENPGEVSSFYLSLPKGRVRFRCNYQGVGPAYIGNDRIPEMNRRDCIENFGGFVLSIQPEPETR